ncbi:transmembrane protein DUF3566 [Microbacteriaceae bacterium MWH-Ta3]|jgi:flagellar biosynthesis protein FlhB|nr:transmembrane protein DUF3566 [Microbacteriaceae bacterium MWH-Ta3]
MATKTAEKQVRLRLVHIDFWSALKTSFVVSSFVSIILAVVSLASWGLLTVVGVLGKIDELVNAMVGTDGTGLTDLLSFPSVLVFSILTAIVNLICGTALGALGSVAYNIVGRITGGLRVGFTND